TFDQYTVETREFSSSDVQNRSLKPYERFIGDLLNPETERGEGRKQLYAAAHQRIVSPLYAFVFALVGGCFLVLSRYSRRGRFKTIAMATLTVASIQIVATTLLNATEFLEWAIPGTYLMLGTIIIF